MTPQGQKDFQGWGPVGYTPPYGCPSQSPSSLVGERRASVWTQVFVGHDAGLVMLSGGQSLNAGGMGLLLYWVGWETPRLGGLPASGEGT